MLVMGSIIFSFRKLLLLVVEKVRCCFFILSLLILFNRLCGYMAHFGIEIDLRLFELFVLDNRIQKLLLRCAVPNVALAIVTAADGTDVDEDGTFDVNGVLKFARVFDKSLRGRPHRAQRIVALDISEGHFMLSLTLNCISLPFWSDTSKGIPL